MCEKSDNEKRMSAALTSHPANGPMTSSKCRRPCSVWTCARADGDDDGHLIHHWDAVATSCPRSIFAQSKLQVQAKWRIYFGCREQSCSSKVDVWQSFPEAMSALKRGGVAFLHVKSVPADNKALVRTSRSFKISMRSYYTARSNKLSLRNKNTQTHYLWQSNKYLMKGGTYLAQVCTTWMNLFMMSLLRYFKCGYFAIEVGLV